MIGTMFNWTGAMLTTFKSWHIVDAEHCDFVVLNRNDIFDMKFWDDSQKLRFIQKDCTSGSVGTASSKVTCWLAIGLKGH